MPLGTLQHFTIERSDLERTKSFYCDVLGMEVGDRPALDFPGYSLYSGGNTTTPADSTLSPLPPATLRACAGDSHPMTSNFRGQVVPRTGDTQIFLYDPDRVGVELNFPKT